MEQLKTRIREAVRAARFFREAGQPRSSANCLTHAGELRRTAYYVYGASSRF